MGCSHSRKCLDLSNSDDYEDERSQSESKDDNKYEDAPEDRKTVLIKAVDDLDSKLKALKLKYSSVQNHNFGSAELPGKGETNAEVAGSCFSLRILS